jgi:DNA-binding NtrC family response regulator
LTNSPDPEANHTSGINFVLKLKYDAAPFSPEYVPAVDKALLKAVRMVEKSRKNILILDPERDTAELFSRALESHSDGYKCFWVNNCQQARSLFSEIPFTFLLADISMFQQDYFLLLDSIKKAACGTVVIVAAYLNESNSIKKAMEMGAAGYFIKPVTVGSLRKLIDDFSASR